MKEEEEVKAEGEIVVQEAEVGKERMWRWRRHGKSEKGGRGRGYVIFK